MFDAVRNNKRIVQVFLGLITLPFAFWGIDSYVRSGGAGSDLASVGDSKITTQQFEQALRERQDQLRQSMGSGFKAEMMNSPEVRLGILNGLIDQRLLLLEASAKRLGTSDETLRNFIAAVPALQENGKFSMERYESVLRAQGMSQQQFEARIRQDLTLQQLIGSLGSSAFVSSTQAEALLRIQAEERQFSDFRIPAAQFADKVKLDADAAQKFYDENKGRFEIPEQVKGEYVVLSLDALMSQVTVSDAEIKAWYDAHLDLYQQPEERRASHILILAQSDATDEAKKAAKAKAEGILADLQKSPARFAELAKQYSQDPGSAQKGGDLGYFGHGMMVKPFDEAAFSLKENELSGLVETEYGYHIIKVTGIRSAKQRPLPEVRPEIEADLRRQAANQKFAEAAENFHNMVYEQSDSLQPVAEKYKLKLQQTDWIAKNLNAQQRAALGPLANDKVLSGLFSDDAIKDKRNTEAVEVAPNTLVAARVLEHRAAAMRPFDEVKRDIEKALTEREALALATKDGEARLAELHKGEADKIAWSPARTVSRLQAAQVQLPPQVLQTIFRADAQKLPAYVGVAVGGGYSLFKISQVTQPEKIDPKQLEALRNQYTEIVAQEDLSAYLSSLRARYKIDVNKSLLENRER